MKTFSKLAATASILTLAATGGAHALDITNATIGGQATSTATPYTLANELDLAGESTTAVIRVDPTTGSFPVGNVLMTVSLQNATFDGAVQGSSVVGIDAGGPDCSLATASISAGGAAGGSSVTFLISNAQGCEVGGAEGLRFTQDIILSGTGSVSMTANVTTELGNQVDGPSAVSETLLALASGFDAAVTADTGVTTAALPAFTAFTGGSDKILGTATVALSTARSDFAGTAVVAGDLASVTVSVTGDMSAYSGVGGVFVDLNANGVMDGNEELTIAGSTASRVFTGADVTALTAAARNIRVLENGTTAIQASSYSANVVVNPDVAAVPIGFKAADESAGGLIQSVAREGTQITMPWLASGTQAGLTGSTNLVRLGNVSGTAITAVYAQVLTASNGAFINPGVVQIPGFTLAAGETKLLSGADIEAAIGGNWGTGDVQITIEAPSTALTARRLIFNGSSFTEITSGTVAQDQ